MIDIGIIICIFGIEIVVFVGGCFWGMEDLICCQFGVFDICVGYMGGDNDYVIYCNYFGYVEVVEIVFDLSMMIYCDILVFFFQIYDLLMLNCQGNDIGLSYWLVIFLFIFEQEQVVCDMIVDVDVFGLWLVKVVMMIEFVGLFWEVEFEYQDYLIKYLNGYICYFFCVGWVLLKCEEVIV